SRGRSRQEDSSHIRACHGQHHCDDDHQEGGKTDHNISIATCSRKRQDLYALARLTTPLFTSQRVTDRPQFTCRLPNRDASVQSPATQNRWRIPVTADRQPEIGVSDSRSLKTCGCYADDGECP